MASRQDLRDVIELAARAIGAGEDTGVFAAEDAAAAAAASGGAQPVGAPTPVQLGIATTVAAPMMGTVAGNADLTYELTPDQAAQVAAAFSGLVQQLKDKVAGIEV